MKNLSLVILALGFVLSGCVTQQAVQKEVAKMEKGPSVAPRKIITNFSDGLRCMDNTLIEYGIRDVSMLVEDLSDNTSSVKAGSKDMLITAVSKMTRRSRAIKLIPFGNDSGNLIAFLGNAGSESPYNIIPQYDIRGSISQLDKSVVSKQAGVSLAVDEFSVGGSKSVAGSILGLDLSVLSTSDLSVIHGVTSSNSVVLFKTGKGADTDATIKKTGVSFDFSVDKSEAVVQALRNLIELASIELIGKLTKVPYWRCLGIPETSADIKQEMEDWYYAMSTHGEIVPYIRSLLVARNFYPSVVVNENLALNAALTSFRQSMNMPASSRIDFEVFYALLNGKTQMNNQENAQQLAGNNSSNINSSVVSSDQVGNQSLQKTPAVSAMAISNQKPFTLNIRSGSGKKSFARGEAIQLVATASESAYVYCYLTDDRGDMQRFFPNRFQKNNFIQAGAEISLPGNMPFDIVANEQGKTELVDCFATRKNAYSSLPDQLKVYDFEIINGANIQDVRNGYQSAVNGGFAESRFSIQSR
jgi:hypothetical protein